MTSTLLVIHVFVLINKYKSYRVEALVINLYINKNTMLLVTD